MDLVLPTLIITGLTVLIVWGGFTLVAHLEQISGGGYGHDDRYKPTTEQQAQATEHLPSEELGATVPEQAK